MVLILIFHHFDYLKTSKSIKIFILNEKQENAIGK